MSEKTIAQLYVELRAFGYFEISSQVTDLREGGHTVGILVRFSCDGTAHYRLGKYNVMEVAINAKDSTLRGVIERALLIAKAMQDDIKAELEKVV